VALCLQQNAHCWLTLYWFLHSSEDWRIKFVHFSLTLEKFDMFAHLDLRPAINVHRDHFLCVWGLCFGPTAPSSIRPFRNCN